VFFNPHSLDIFDKKTSISSYFYLNFLKKLLIINRTKLNTSTLNEERFNESDESKIGKLKARI